MGFPFPFTFFSCLEIVWESVQKVMECEVHASVHASVLSFELILSFARIGLLRGLS